MNYAKLKQAEAAFLDRYPGGFKNMEIQAIRRKKHNVDRMIALAKESLARRNFESPDLILENMTRIIGRSSVISVFEKAQFRECADLLSLQERARLSGGLQELLHGEEYGGFETMLDVLMRHKLGKWSLMTLCPTYYHPHKDVLVKPNTVKNIIQHFELSDLQYRPTPSWEFYDTYRATIHEMKSKVDACLSPTNAAFSWFLLLSTRGAYIS